MGIKKRLDEVTAQISHWISRIPGSQNLTKPTFITMIRTRLIEVIYIGVIIVLTAGGVNAALEGSGPNIQQALITTSRGVQTWGETFMNFFYLAIGTAGLYMIYLSGRPTSRRRVSNLYFLAGLVAILLSVFIGFYIQSIKRF